MMRVDNFKEAAKSILYLASNCVKLDSPGRGVTPPCLPAATLSQKDKKIKLKTKQKIMNL